MGHIAKVRRGNASDSRFFTIPMEIAHLYDIKIGDELEIMPQTIDSFILRKVRK